MGEGLVGTRLAQFRIVEMLGEGGMGRVYRARDEKLERDVALKVIHPKVADEPRYRRRFMQEAKAAAAVTHAGIATVYDAGEADGTLFIAMEWVAGRSLAQALRDGPLPFDEAARIALAIARALSKAHDAGVVHRDLKPDNVMLTGDGGVKVLDFGIARRERSQQDGDTALAEAETATEEGAVMGTPGYMSPEQALGIRLDHRTDLFSLGVLLYEALAGRRPFEGQSLMETAIAVTRDEPLPLDEVRRVPVALQQIVERCLCKSPDDRYASAQQLADALEQAPVDETGDDATLEDAATVLAPAKLALGEQPKPARTPAPARRSAYWLLGLATVVAIAAVWLNRDTTAASDGATSGSGSTSASASASASSLATAIPITALPPPASTSPAAIKAYQQGLHALRSSNWGLAKTHFRKALEHDPDMAAAHLRIALDGLSGASFVEARKHLQLATAGQDSLSARDRIVLAALEPVVARERPDWDAFVERWREATRAHPNDAELWYMLGAAYQRSGRDDESLPAIERAIALDPEYTDALQAAGIALLRKGRWEEAIKRFDACIASSPTTGDCVWDRVHIHEVRGECDDMLAAVKLANVRQSPNGYAYRHLAAGLLSTGEGWDAVAGALKKADEVRGLERAFRGAEDAMLVSAARGDFVRAAAEAHEMMKHDKVSALALMLGARQLMLIHGETGDEAARKESARAYLAARHSVLTTFGISPWQDPTPLALRLTIDDPKELADKRDAWIESWRGRQDSNAARLWLQAFALPALDEAQARAAIAQRPEALDARVLNRDVGTEIIDALVHAKAKHARAKTLLERATKSCAWLTEPILNLRGWDALGEIHERDSQPQAACRAYRHVLKYWGKAKPRSLTAEHARARNAALPCSDE